MSTLLSVLNGPSPQEIRGRGGSPFLRQQAAESTGLDDLVARIEQIQSPFGQEFARGFIKKRFGVDIPRSEELEMQRRESALALQKLTDAERQFTVRRVLGFLVDNAAAPVDEAFTKFTEMTGLVPKVQVPRGVSLEDLLRDRGVQGDLGVGLLDRPEDLRGASQLLATIFGEPGLELRTEDLLGFPLTQQAASQTPEERAAGKVKEQATVISAQQEIAKESEAFVTGVRKTTGGKEVEDPLAAQFTRNLERQEARAARAGGDVDLVPRAFDLEDYDTEAGAQGFVSAVDETIRGLAGLDLMTFTPALLQREESQRMGEALAESITLAQEGEDVVAAPANEVGQKYLNLLDILSRQSGIRVDRIFELLNLGELGVTRIQKGLQGSLSVQEAAGDARR